MESGISDDRTLGGHSRWRKKRWVIPGFVLIAFSAAFLTAWFSRFEIAEDFIESQLQAYDLPATYKIDQISGTTQIISNLVIGDPDAPDFTAKQAIISVRYGLGLPEIGAIALKEPRIFGRYSNDRLSFGSLDAVIFAEGDEEDAAPALPDIDLRLSDARGLVETQWGAIGIKAEGRGNLSDGYSGIIAASAPDLVFAGCKASGATLFGGVATKAGVPSFKGPMRLRSFECRDADLEARDYAFEIEAQLDESLAKPRLEAVVDGGRLKLGDMSLASLNGTLAASKPEDVVTARYSLRANDFAAPQVLAARFTMEGQARANGPFERVEAETQLAASGIRSGSEMIAALEGLAKTGEGTFLSVLADRFVRAVRSELRGSTLSADMRFRREGDRFTFLTPSAELRGGGGARLMSLSRFEMSVQGDALPQIAGNIATGGPGMPKLTGRMEGDQDGHPVFRLSMERYGDSVASLAIPALSFRQLAGGGLRFDGSVLASGALPGGGVQDLALPLRGQWTASGELSLWDQCAEIGFGRLELANLRFERRAVKFCPPPAGAILTYGAGGLKFAAGTDGLSMVGSLAETPITIETGAIGIAYPGVMTARAIDVVLGPAETASRFRVADLDAFLDQNVSGTFADVEVQLAAVPADLRNVSGVWDYQAGVLNISDASFQLNDREASPRFKPLIATNARLRLQDNAIDAQADLLNPDSNRVVTAIEIDHDLSTGNGTADIVVPGLFFDEGLQPEQLSELAKGIIANAKGTLIGSGKVSWSADGVTQSSGVLSTEAFDFAAAFGPVTGVRGAIEFIDLVNLTTAPEQMLRIATVNPGVEVLDGEVTFQLRNGQLLALEGGSWPFMGGRLILRGVDLNFAVSEERRYIFEIIGLEAQQFVTQMELENISATGIFDGTVPIIFDENGDGSIQTGVLISRPPGGNVSYVGELTYEDLSPIANFAFDALRSLNYDQMRVVMEGPLSGEIVTRVRFDGVSQGEGASGNFITKQLAALPLQFRLNIRAQFYQLLTSLKTLYDPAAVRDPRDLGLLSDDGSRLIRKPDNSSDESPDGVTPNEPVIQAQESEGAL